VSSDRLTPEQECAFNWLVRAGNNARVRVDADAWIDYMHLALWNGEWKIINVLWAERRVE
jgi:hypothetical protein